MVNKEVTIWWKWQTVGKGGKEGKEVCPMQKEQHVCEHGALGNESRLSGTYMVNRREGKIKLE